MELEAGIGDGELPIRLGVALAAAVFPGSNFLGPVATSGSIAEYLQCGYAASDHAATSNNSIDRRVNDLSGAIFVAALVDVPIPAASRLRPAQEPGVAAAVEAAMANRDRPRSLHVGIATPGGERVVGRDVAFSLVGLDPVWVTSTTIRVDFGAGKPLFGASAEAVQTSRRMAHSYDPRLTAHLAITTTEAPKPGETVPIVLGHGSDTVPILPSLVTTAQELADAFINLRFGLALLIAPTVYYWRYHSRTTTFGARGYDCVEAFALGFAMDVNRHPTGTPARNSTKR